MSKHEELIAEYRPTMHVEVLHSWAKDAKAALEAQAREIEGLKANGPEVVLGTNDSGQELNGPMRTAWQLAQSAAHAEAQWADELSKEVEGLRKDAALGRVAMRFVDRAGDVHPGIDDAETICADFHAAMEAELDKHLPEAMKGVHHGIT